MNNLPRWSFWGIIFAATMIGHGIHWVLGVALLFALLWFEYHCISSKD